MSVTVLKDIFVSLNQDLNIFSSCQCCEERTDKAGEDSCDLWQKTGWELSIITKIFGTGLRASNLEYAKYVNTGSRLPT